MFTWSNHQLDHVQSVLDRVLTSPEWEAFFPRPSLATKSFIGSDHTPLLLDSGLNSSVIPRPFKFDASCLLVEGFFPLVLGKIIEFFWLAPRIFWSSG